MPTFPYVKRSYQHLDHPKKKRNSHYRLGLNRAIASSTILHEEASALRSQYYLSLHRSRRITPWAVEAVWSSARVMLKNSPHHSALKFRTKLSVEPVKTFLHKTYYSTGACREDPTDHRNARAKKRTKLAQICSANATLFCTNGQEPI